MSKLLNKFSWYLFIRFVRPIEIQVRDFLTWKARYGDVNKDAEYVYMFIELANKRSIEDITDQDVKDFARYILNTRSKFHEISALKSIRCFVRYHKARKVSCISPKTVI